MICFHGEDCYRWGISLLASFQHWRMGLKLKGKDRAGSGPRIPCSLLGGIVVLRGGVGL